MECPICYDTFNNEIYMCLAGHSVCSDCCKSIFCCPICRKPMSSRRNIAMEEIIAEMQAVKENDCPICAIPAPKIKTKQFAAHLDNHQNKFLTCTKSFEYRHRFQKKAKGTERDLLIVNCDNKLFKFCVESDYSVAGRSHHSTLLWHQRPRQNNSKPRSKISSIALAAAAFLVFVTVLSIAGLALYMGALRSEAPTQLLTFSGSAKILRGDRFISHHQEKSRKYKQLLENLYHKSSIGPALVSCVLERFGDDAATIYFRLSLNRRKLSRSISNLEKTLKDILLNDSISRRPVFRGIRFDPRSVHIRQILDNENSHQKVITKPKETFKTRSGVLHEPTKRNLTVTADIPIKRKSTTTTELNFKEEDLPVIQGSFHISKTEADITEKKNAINDTTTHRPKANDKTKQPLKTTTLKESSITSALYKIATLSKDRKSSEASTATTKAKTTSFSLKTTTTPLKTTTTPFKTTNSPSKTTSFQSKATTSSSVPNTSVIKNSTFSPKVTTNLSTKYSFTINPYLFTVPPHSLDKEPWVPIQRVTEISEKPKLPMDLEIKPTVSLIERLHQKQPVYTSFTNPGLSFHSINMETLGSTSMVGHPLPVNKITVVTESSFTNVNLNEALLEEAETAVTEISDETTSASFEIEHLEQEKLPVQPAEQQSEVFVEVETLKHVPGSTDLNLDEENLSATKSKWELLNNTQSSLTPNVNNESRINSSGFFNNSVGTMATINGEDLELHTKLNQTLVLTNESSIFRNLASSLGIISPSNVSLPNISSTTTTTSTIKPSLDSYSDAEMIEENYENVKESTVGHGHAEVVEVDEESLMLESQASTRFPLVTLIPVKSNSGVGRPLRPRPKRPSNVTELVENRSFPSDPFYKNLNMDLADLSKSSIKFVQTEVVTSVSTEINRVKINKNHLNDFKILSVLNFETESYHDEATTSPYLNNGTNEQSMFKKSVIENEAESVRNPKMDPKKNFTTPLFENYTPNNVKLKDEVSVFSVNSSVSINKSEKIQMPYNILTEDKLKQLSEISKLHPNITHQDTEPLLSNKAISASYTVNQAGFKILTKTFNKVPSFSKEEEKKSVLGFNVVSATSTSNKTECNNFTVKCGDGQCLPDTTRCNQLLDCSDGADEKNCNCADYLKSQYLLRKICDGVVDCWDFSDENLCEWCKPEQYVCGNSKFCIDKNRICDGVKDCPNGDDERQCVTVAPNIQAADKFPYYSEGYLLVRKHGRWGKLCMQNFEEVVTKLRPPWQISDLGQAVCKAMTYKKLNSITSVVEPKYITSRNHNYNDRYFELTYTFLNVTKSNLLFKESSCQSGEVIKLQCQTLECGTRPQAINQQARIVGGGNAGLGSWPWQAALYKEGEFQCGATLISDRWLLSAGHCFFHSLEEHWVARLGALRRGTALPSPYEQLRPITQIMLHPGYVDSGFINDISLLKMEASITFSDYVRPICLPSSNSILNDGRICTVIGWGQLFEVGRIFPDTLQEVQIPVISTAECRKHTLFLPLYKITDDMFCAGYERGGRDACLGDSGGPLMCTEPDGRWVLYGITSNGYGCARANRPGVYTKVANYITWIQAYIHNNAAEDIAVNRTTCYGHRCPLGECLPKSRLCNGYIECSDGSDEKDCANNS